MTETLASKDLWYAARDSVRYPTTLPSSSTTRSVSALVTKITYSSVRPLASSTMLTQRTKNHFYQCWLQIVAPGKKRKRTILVKQLLSVVANANANTFSFLFTNIDCKGDHNFQIQFIFFEVGTTGVSKLSSPRHQEESSYIHYVPDFSSHGNVLTVGGIPIIRRSRQMWVIRCGECGLLGGGSLWCNVCWRNPMWSNHVGE